MREAAAGERVPRRGEGLADRRGGGGDARDELVEASRRAPARLDQGELQPRVGERGERRDQLPERVEVAGGDDAVHPQLEPATAARPERREDPLEGGGADEPVVHLGAAAVQRQLDVAQAAAEQRVHERAVEQGAVRHEPEVHPEAGGPAGPLDELRPQGRLAPGEDHHVVPEPRGAVDPRVDLAPRRLEAARLLRVAEGARVVAGVADLHERAHRGHGTSSRRAKTTPARGARR